MTTVLDENVFNLAVEGTFDDCQVSTTNEDTVARACPPIVFLAQDIVKALFSDKSFNAEYRLGAINSINWARILAQIVYYFSAYFTLQRQLASSGDAATPTVQFAVPTGNFGDVLAGYYAKRLGLPCAQLVVATNANDILARFWKTGRYEKAASSGTSSGPSAPQTEPAAGSSDGAQAQHVGGVAETLSPAMDILVSSNFERLLFYLALEGCTDGHDDESSKVREAARCVNDWMDKLKTEGRVVVPEKAVEAARRDMIADRASDEHVRSRVKLKGTAIHTSILIDRFLFAAVLADF